MMLFNIRDWYWIIADSTTQVFSSKTCTYVAATNDDYLAFLGLDLHPTLLATEQELVSALLAQAPDLVPLFPLGLAAYAQRKQAAVRNMSIQVQVTGQTVTAWADPASISLLQGAYTLAQAQPSRTFKWVGDEGAVTVSAADIGTIFAAVANFIQETYTVLSDVLDGITGGTITTVAQIDNAAWPTS